MKQTTDAPPPVIIDEKAKFEHSNPWAQKASKLYNSFDVQRENDYLYLALMAIAFELNKMRTGNINVEAQVTQLRT